jgi:SlyX protein
VCGQATRILGAMSETDRLTRLEERYAHLQRHTTQQDKVMLQLAEDLAKLRAEVAALKARSTGGEESEPADERPPHY